MTLSISIQDYKKCSILLFKTPHQSLLQQLGKPLPSLPLQTQKKIWEIKPIATDLNADKHHP